MSPLASTDPSSTYQRLVDRLLQVSTRENSEQWVYTQVEVLGQYDAHFPERLFTISISAASEPAREASVKFPDTVARQRTDLP